MLLCLVKYRAASFGFFSVAWNGFRTGLLGCGQDRDGPRGQALMRSRPAGLEEGSGGGRRIAPRPAPGCGSRIAGQAAPGGSGLAAQVGVDQAGGVALEAADDLGFGQAFLAAPGDVGAGRRVRTHPGDHDPPQAWLACRSPPRLSRCRFCVLPEVAGIGAEAHRCAHAASDRSRPGWSPDRYQQGRGGVRADAVEPEQARCGLKAHPDPRPASCPRPGQTGGRAERGS